jgi:hypothetical protein
MGFEVRTTANIKKLDVTSCSLICMKVTVQNYLSKLIAEGSGVCKERTCSNFIAFSF